MMAPPLVCACALLCLLMLAGGDAGPGAATAPPSTAPSTAPVAAVLSRVLGAKTAAIFDLTLDPSMKQGFRLANAAAAATSTGSGGPNSAAVISVTASSSPELAFGAAYYLRTHADMSFAWARAGGNQVKPPTGGFPRLTASVAIYKKAKWSYYQNVCTQSYSMWWWDWDRWEQEIDWMALWGINLVLAYTGQEAIFKQVYNSIGVNDTVLNQTFDGPAFLTWSRGQGDAHTPHPWGDSLDNGSFFGFGTFGPLPSYFMDSQHKLQVKIMNRLRELDMHGILPGFQGNVPISMPEIFPQANTSAGWVDALDPLFDTIAGGVATKMQSDFGPAEFVEADGWFALETGPWLYSNERSSFKDGQESFIPSVGHLAGAAARTSSDSLKELQQRQIDQNFLELMRFAGKLQQQEQDQEQEQQKEGEERELIAPCTVSKPEFIVPTEEEAFSRAKVVFTSLVQASPNSTWVYQGYPWYRVYRACPQSRPALRSFVRGFTRAIPEGKLLVLDLEADSPGNAIWAYPNDPVTKQPFVQNATVIWCALANWGGAVHIGGDITFVLNQTREFFAKSPNAGGVGLTPEGIDNAPAYFSLVLDTPWTPVPTAAAWLTQWGRGRCGASSPLADKAYELLAQSVYRPGKPYLPCCALPAFCPTILPDEFAEQKGYTGQIYPDYNATILRQALEAFVTAAPDCQTDAFMYDLVDVAREWLSMMPCLNLLVGINATVPAATLKTRVAELLELYADVDEMMRTEPGFLLGSWLKHSRAVADWDGSKGSLADFYEWNARTQISSWAGHYSRREWSGMVHGGKSEELPDGSGYYSGRMKLWLNYTLAEAAPPADPKKQLPALKAALQTFDDTWSRRKWDESKLPSKPVGEPVAIAAKLLTKYSE